MSCSTIVYRHAARRSAKLVRRNRTSEVTSRGSKRRLLDVISIRAASNINAARNGRGIGKAEDAVGAVVSRAQ